MSFTLTIPLRSGLFLGLIETFILLIISPIATRGTAQLHNLVSTHGIRHGRLVRISDHCVSIEELLPRLLSSTRFFSQQPRSARRCEAVRQGVTLSVSAFVTVGILLFTLSVDGRSEGRYEKRELHVWNGGRFVDTGGEGFRRARDVLGMAVARRACVGAGGLMFAVGFEGGVGGGGVANRSVCLDGEGVRERWGVEVGTDEVFGGGWGGDGDCFEVDLGGVSAGEYFRVNGTGGEWTLVVNPLGHGVGVRAVRKGGGIEVKGGVVVVGGGCNEGGGGVVLEERFSATVREIGVRQDVRQMELAVLDMFALVMVNPSRLLSSQEVMLRAYYAGGMARFENGTKKVLGRSEKVAVEVREGEREVTVVSVGGVVGLIMVVVGGVALLVVAVAVKAEVRLTSTKYVTKVLRTEAGEGVGGHDDGGMDFVRGARDPDGRLRVAVVRVSEDCF